MADMLTSQDVDRQIGLARADIAKLEKHRPDGNDPEDLAWWIGRLETRLELLLDAIDRDREPRP